jgi:hypothetical protein
MEVGQGPIGGCSAIGKKNLSAPIFLKLISKILSLQIFFPSHLSMQIKYTVSHLVSKTDEHQ